MFSFVIKKRINGLKGPNNKLIIIIQTFVQCEPASTANKYNKTSIQHTCLRIANEGR